MVFSPDVKMWHYRLAIILLYNEEMPGVTRDGLGVDIDIKELSSWLGQRVYRIRSCLGNLEALGIIRDLDMEDHVATFKLEVPAGFVLDKPRIL